MTSRSLETLCAGCPDLVGGKACAHGKVCLGATCLCVGFVALPALLLAAALMAGLVSLV